MDKPKESTTELPTAITKPDSGQEHAENKAQGRKGGFADDELLAKSGAHGGLESGELLAKGGTRGGIIDDDTQLA